ncbi:carbon storage regulator [Planctopirus ephydatiae]|uniref:Carbon storage regulator n=1 Tax=Planctopirus ephydatiae TaxID=2528019 RepID=A0A518GNR1_9PLAN|nr:carbon storage regulator [Planctopirus ephydatiae]QDV30091.1 carbon storage regulator [Planctopirus ephydatiae]
MLVLSRKYLESVRFELTEPLPAGTIIEVRLVRIGNQTVRLGIEAPTSINIVRDELTHAPELKADSAA